PDPKRRHWRNPDPLVETLQCRHKCSPGGGKKSCCLISHLADALGESGQRTAIAWDCPRHRKRPFRPRPGANSPAILLPTFGAPTTPALVVRAFPKAALLHATPN